MLNINRYSLVFIPFLGFKLCLVSSKGSYKALLSLINNSYYCLQLEYIYKYIYIYIVTNAPSSSIFQSNGVKLMVSMPFLNSNFPKNKIFMNSNYNTFWCRFKEKSVQKPAWRKFQSGTQLYSKYMPKTEDNWY